MERIELLSLTETEAVYKYFPEHETEIHGIVSVNRQSGKRTIRQLADGYGSEYAFHAFNEIERYIAVDNFRPTGMVAWY